MNNFYIYHTTSKENLLEILKSNVLYASKYISKKHLRLSGKYKVPYIFTRIYLDEDYN